MPYVDRLSSGWNGGCSKARRGFSEEAARARSLRRKGIVIVDLGRSVDSPRSSIEQRVVLLLASVGQYQPRESPRTIRKIGSQKREDAHVRSVVRGPRYVTVGRLRSLLVVGHSRTIQRHALHAPRLDTLVDSRHEAHLERWRNGRPERAAGNVAGLSLAEANAVHGWEKNAEGRSGGAEGAEGVGFENQPACIENPARNVIEGPRTLRDSRQQRR
ncbi:hypothetical protein KM043_001428 [Ampulex compressa]|nr:hypothetical protein KM043_001428 [Ampulex compressa]